MFGGRTLYAEGRGPRSRVHAVRPHWETSRTKQARSSQLLPQIAPCESKRDLPSQQLLHRGHSGGAFWAGSLLPKPCAPTALGPGGESTRAKSPSFRRDRLQCGPGGSKGRKGENQRLRRFCVVQGPGVGAVTSGTFTSLTTL